MRGKSPVSRFAHAACDVAEAVRFFTRLPLGAADGKSLDFDRVAWAAPVAGAIVGLVGSGVLALTQPLGLPPLFRAGLATAAVVAVTGALHEDGLADAADGFGGGAGPARKLEIMRDSRIGAYGAVALTLALILRVGALAAALERRILERGRGADRWFPRSRAPAPWRRWRCSNRRVPTARAPPPDA